MSFMTQCLCVLLATYLCHCTSFTVSFWFYDSSLIITSSYVVDTLIYILNLSILEHFFRIPSYYLLLYIDPDSNHADFTSLIDKDSGDLVMSDGDSLRARSESEDSTSSTSSLVVATSELGDDDMSSPISSATQLARNRFRSWSVDSNGGRYNTLQGQWQWEGRRGAGSGSELGGSESGSKDANVPARYIRACKGNLEVRSFLCGCTVVRGLCSLDVYGAKCVWLCVFVCI